MLDAAAAQRLLMLYMKRREDYRFLHTQAVGEKRIPTAFGEMVGRGPIMGAFSADEIADAVDDRILSGEIRHELPRLMEEALETSNSDELMKWCQTRLGKPVIAPYISIEERETDVVHRLGLSLNELQSLIAQGNSQQRSR